MMLANLIAEPLRRIGVEAPCGLDKTVLRTIIIDSCALFREGLKQALLKIGFDVVASESDLKNVRLESHVSDLGLLIIIAPSDDRVADVRALHGARSRFPGSILVSLCQDCVPKQASQLLRAGASAILTVPQHTEDLADVLELVALGQRVVPIELISSCIGEGEQDDVEPLDAMMPSRTFADLENKPIRLSTREIEILRCLLAGESNRSIARRLAIGEATVKVHVKAVLRKIKVKNRTQAAIWAISNMKEPAEKAPLAIPGRTFMPLTPALA